MSFGASFKTGPSFGLGVGRPRPGIGYGEILKSLFSNGEQGALYTPWDLSTMYQDAAGTTPAAIDSPVGLLVDQSGNGNDASQSTAAARPVLRETAGGLRYLEFDGVDDYLITQNNLGISGDFSGTAFVAGSTTYTNTDYPAYFTVNDNDPGNCWALTMNSRKPAFDIWGDRIIADNSLDGSAHVHALNKTPGTLTDTATIRVDGDQVPTDTNSSIPSLTDSPLMLGRLEGGRELPCNVYGVAILDRNVTGAERESAENELAKRAGVTL